ncbi:MAG: 4,5-DOPA dioxygenase extradiol [Burkholderiaceae bacterium]
MPTSSSSGRRLPALFLGHGSPMNALQENAYTALWRRLGDTLPRPRAILVVSAHWCTRGIGVTAMAAPRTIHDFGGFPQALFDMRYPAPGDPALAARIQELLAPLPVHPDHDWGLDHGTWSVLCKVYPEADIPVLQLSLDLTQPAAWHFELGARLAPLRDQGVLLVGTGNVVHNLRLMTRGGPAATPDWATAFNDRVRAVLADGDLRALADYAGWGPEAQLAVPTVEHYLPLLYAAGSHQPGDAVTILIDGIEAGTLSMLSVAIGDPAVVTA